MPNLICVFLQALPTGTSERRQRCLMTRHLYAAAAAGETGERRRIRWLHVGRSCVPCTRFAFSSLAGPRWRMLSHLTVFQRVRIPAVVKLIGSLRWNLLVWKKWQPCLSEWIQFQLKNFFFLLNLHLPEPTKDHRHKKLHSVLLDFCSCVMTDSFGL